MKFDVVVVGAGHAGIEAALATSRLGLSTVLITTNLARIGYMSCNPSIGGLAKGHMVREIDILGGEMGRAADLTCIQFKRLNSRKGPAVRGSRVQSDKEKYCEYMGGVVQGQMNLRTLEGEVRSLRVESGHCGGVLLGDGSFISSKATIITAGTFLNGVMHVGKTQTPGGRIGDSAVGGLSDQMIDLGFDVRRLKTGTPPRLRRASINFEALEAQWGDELFYPFSLRSSKTPVLRQVPCFLSRTTEATHDIIRANLDQSPMYSGAIEGIGPRYCPSIEDKVVRFSSRSSHQTFLEPEGLDSDLMYLQGISTSLPADVQHKFLKTIPGLERVEVVRPGYAVEYDFFEPTQIWHRLETRPIKQLFLAGQINGTSGYEEAAAQGLVAGINAAHSILGRPEFVLSRDEAYIGVLIDDLVTKGTLEPYRMFTSRAEHRLVLREDNTIDRLAGISSRVCLIGEDLKSRVDLLQKQRAELGGFLSNSWIYPNVETQTKLRELGTSVLTKPLTLYDLAKRVEVSCFDLSKFGLRVEDFDPEVLEGVEIDVKYSGYVLKQLELIRQSKEHEDALLPLEMDYRVVKGLSNEEVEKLARIKPRTLGQALRISGVNPSAIQSIMIYLRGARGGAKASE